MKKLLTICIAVAVMGVAAQAQIGDIASLDKTFDVDSAGLCEHVTGEIVVETTDADVDVMDEMPEGIALVDVSVSGGAYSNLSFNEDGLQVTLDEAAEYTISIEVQVTDVLAYDSVVVTNEATATDQYGNNDTASDDLELLAYEAFSKTLEVALIDATWDTSDYTGPLGTPVDPDAVPIGTKVYFLMYVDGDNDLGIDMLNAYVKDNLGGDLELEYWITDFGDSSPYVISDPVMKTSGKTEKQHLLWEIGDIPSGDDFISDLMASTDVNTGNGNGKKDGHQEYTEEGIHYLNSGATLKFTASDTGLTCSVSDEGIEIEVVAP
jgi:hypothetical protein